MSKEGLMSGQGRSYGSTMGGDGGNSDYNIRFAGPSAGPSSPGFFDDAQFYRLCDNITTNIYTIGKHATTLEKTLKTIGSKNDSIVVRDSVHIVQTTANKLISETAQNIKQLGLLSQPNQTFENSSEKDAKLRKNKLTSDFQASVQRYTDVQKQIVTKIKATVLPLHASTMMESEDQGESLVQAEEQIQKDLQLQQQLEFEQGMLIEREERIRKIESDIVDVNDIMRDLASMVHEQGTAVDSIEENISSAYTEVEAGREQLQKAATYQTKYRKRLFCLLGTGFVVLVIVVIILVTELKSK